MPKNDKSQKTHAAMKNHIDSVVNSNSDDSFTYAKERPAPQAENFKIICVMLDTESFSIDSNRLK